MRGISTLNLLLKGSVFAAALTAGSFNAFGQTFPPTTETCETTTAENASGCPNIDITFENPDGSGSAFGFTGDFVLNGASSTNASSDFDLQSTPVSEGTRKVLYSFPFNAVAFGSVDYTFEVSGPANITSYSVYLEALDANGTHIDYFAVCSGEIELTNSAPTKVCGNAAFPSVEGATSFRLVFVFEITGQGQQTIAVDNFGSTLFSAGAPMPVTFVGVSAKKASKGTQITWNVADEFNVSRYEVQKGSNAGDLKTIGIVFAGEKSTYTFTDEQPSQGVSFYRIRSVDTDGKYKFSTVISFSNGKSVAILRAYPMPARNQVTLQHGTIEGKAQITISSEDGRIVKRLTPSVGSMLTPIDLSTLKAGLYLLRLESSNGEVETLKLVKQ